MLKSNIMVKSYHISFESAKNIVQALSINELNFTMSFMNIQSVNTIEWTIESISPLLLECAKIALKYYDNPTRTIKSDNSIVTEADRDIEAYLESVLSSPETGNYLLGEETIKSRDENYIECAMKNRAWVVDPIDGTAPYSFHIPIWGISLGLMENSILIEGAIYLPVTKEMFITSDGKVFYAVFTESFSDKTVLSKIDFQILDPSNIDQASFEKTGILSITQSMAKKGKMETNYVMHSLCCAVVPLSYLCLGRYAGYIGTLNLWDLGGGLPLLKNMGFEISFLDGTPLGREVTAEKYFLSPTDSKRWKAKGAVLFTYNRKLVNKIISEIIYE